MFGRRLFHSHSVQIRRLVIGVLALLPAQTVLGQALPEGHGTQTYRAVRVETPPVIDGDLADPIWQQAEVITDLVPGTGRVGTGEAGTRKAGTRKAGTARDR